MGKCCSSQAFQKGVLVNGDTSPLLSHPSKYSSFDRAKPKPPVKEAKEVLLNSHVALFAHLDSRDHNLLFQACEQFELNAGAVLVKQRDIGDSFFAILSGEAAVIVDGEQVDTWRKGDTFGALSLLRPEPRPETVEAETALSVLRVTREAFIKAGLQHKLKTNRRVGVGYHVGLEADPLPPTSKTPSEQEFLRSAMQQNRSLQVLALDGARIRQLVAVAWREEFKSGVAVVEKGNVADRFYVVESGELRSAPDALGTSNGMQKRLSRTHTQISRLSEASAADGSHSPQQHLRDRAASNGHALPASPDGAEHVGVGQCFGEVDLLYSLPRAVTVFAQTDSVVWVIASKDFREILLEVSRATVEKYMGYLCELESLRFLFAHERRSLAQALAHMSFTKQEFIVEQDVPPDALYLLLSGVVSILKDGKEVERLAVGEPDGAGCYSCLSGLSKFITPTKRIKGPYVLGESALTSEVPSEISVLVCSEVVSTLMLSSETVDLIIGSLAYLTKTRSKDRLVAVLKRIMMARRFAQHFTKGDRKREHETHLTDIEKVADLGCGGFGTVELWQHRGNKTKYAMKIIDKGHVVRKGAQRQVMNERQIMGLLSSPFIIRLVEAYSTKKKLYLLLEVASGGELATVYKRKRLWGSEKHTRYYSAGVVCAFEHIHKKRIIYRDLKPENTLLDGNGQPKLTDFGLAKFTVGKTYTVCGTPGYIAPEMVLHTGYTRSVDWWCFGIFLYELTHGSTPFGDELPSDPLTEITKPKTQWVDICRGTVGSLVAELLVSDPCNRLPLKAGGIQNVLDHEWYKSLNWEIFRQGNMTPPYVPRCKGNRVEAENFNVVDLQRYSAEYVDDGTGLFDKFATVKL